MISPCKSAGGPYVEQKPVKVPCSLRSLTLRLKSQVAIASSHQVSNKTPRAYVSADPRSITLLFLRWRTGESPGDVCRRPLNYQRHSSFCSDGQQILDEERAVRGGDLDRQFHAIANFCGRTI